MLFSNHTAQLVPLVLRQVNISQLRSPHELWQNRYRKIAILFLVCDRKRCYDYCHLQMDN
ncbi:hypothetical protein [Aliterella atlantica]|uniref:hypothetical protein n=1 Tax=Aliterella atlantica TaxID=1827278 RepID=UPI001364D49F